MGGMFIRRRLFSRGKRRINIGKLTYSSLVADSSVLSCQFVYEVEECCGFTSGPKGLNSLVNCSARLKPRPFKTGHIGERTLNSGLAGC